MFVRSQATPRIPNGLRLYAQQTARHQRRYAGVRSAAAPGVHEPNPMSPHPLPQTPLMPQIPTPPASQHAPSRAGGGGGGGGCGRRHEHAAVDEGSSPTWCPQSKTEDMWGHCGPGRSDSGSAFLKWCWNGPQAVQKGGSDKVSKMAQAEARPGTDEKCACGHPGGVGGLPADAIHCCSSLANMIQKAHT